MENNTNKPSFLEELGEKARTKSEVEAEARIRADIESESQMNEAVNKWIDEIKKEITERAKNGEFESILGRKRISGKFNVPGNVSWSNVKQKRKIPLLLMLLGGFFTFGLTWLSLGSDSPDICFVTTMTGRFSQHTQKYIMHLKKRMSEEGIAFNDLHMGLPNMRWGGMSVNDYTKVNGAFCDRRVRGKDGVINTPVKIADLSISFEVETCYMRKDNFRNDDKVNLFVSYSVEF